jgi:phage gp29-like protein
MSRPAGLWVSPTQYVSFAEARRAKAPLNHIATRSRMDGGFAGANLPNPDPILKAQGKDIQVYRDLRSHPRIGGNIRRRKAAVLTLERNLERGNAPARVERFIRDWLADLDLDRILRELLDAPLFGYQPVEIMWQPVGLHSVPADLVGKPPEWFRFDRENRLRFMARDAGPEGELCDPLRFVVAAQDASYANPYGFPDLSMCFWPVTFMKGGLKFWVLFTEKYGSPWLVGKHPRGATDEETDLLLGSLEAMVQDAVAAIPDDSSIDIIEAAGKAGSADVYRELLEYCRSDINVALLGQDQTTEKDTNRASAEAGAEVTNDIRDADAGLACATLNAVIRRVVTVNFGDQAEAPVYVLEEQQSIDEARASRDKTLSEAGLRFTPVYWQRTYNLQADDIAQPLQVEPPAVEFVEPALHPLLDQYVLDQAIAGLSAAELQQQAEQALLPILEALQQGRDETEVLGLLAETRPDLDATALREQLARLLFISNVWGRLSAAAERVDE